MFGLDLTASEWAAVIRAAYLAGRVLYGLSRVIWWYVTDARLVFTMHYYLALATGVAVAAMSVALLLIAVGIQPGDVRTAACIGRQYDIGQPVGNRDADLGAGIMKIRLGLHHIRALRHQL